MADAADGTGRFARSLIYPLTTSMYCGKTAGSIEIPFGIVGRVGPRKHVLHGVQILHWNGQILGEKWCGAMCHIERMRHNAHQLFLPTALVAKLKQSVTSVCFQFIF